MNSLPRFHWTHGVVQTIMEVPTSPKDHTMSRIFEAALAPTAWTMQSTTAQTFYARSAGVLRVTSGRAWVTLHASRQNPQPRWSPETDPGDIFVGPGKGLALRAGQHAVIESWPADKASATHVEWQPDALSARAARWQCGVAQPAHELGLGMAQMARSLGRLLWGLATYAEFLVAGRGKVLTRLESNAP
jgi:hypothetical protein